VSEQRFGDFDENQTHVPDSFLALYRDARDGLPDTMYGTQLGRSPRHAGDG